MVVLQQAQLEQNIGGDRRVVKKLSTYREPSFISLITEPIDSPNQ